MSYIMDIYTEQQQTQFQLTNDNQPAQTLLAYRRNKRMITTLSSWRW